MTTLKIQIRFNPDAVVPEELVVQALHKFAYEFDATGPAEGIITDDNGKRIGIYEIVED